MKIAHLISVIIGLTAFSAQAEVSFFAQISAEATDSNAATARDIAMEKAQRDAFIDVASRLTDQKNIDELNKLTDEQVQMFIREISVKEEHSTATSYRAELNIEINGELLKRYMQENNMFEAVEQKLDILIVPLYAETGTATKLLWEDQNVWRRAWAEKGNITAGGLSFRLLSEDMAGHPKLGADQAFNLSNEDYKQLAQDTHINNIVVVTAVQAGRNTIVLIVKTFPDGKEKRIPVFNDEGKPTETAIEKTVAYLSDAIRNTDPKIAALHKIAVAFSYPSLKVWLETEKALKQVPQIKMLETGSIDNGSVVFSLEYIGTYSALSDELEKNGLRLSADNGKYTLTRSAQ